MSKPKFSADQKGWFYAFFAQGIWGTTGATTKSINFSLHPILLVAIRHSIGAGVLSLNILRSKSSLRVVRQLTKKQWIQICFLGLLGAGLPDWLLVEGIRRCGAIISQMVVRLEIPLGVMLASVMLHEKISRRVIMATPLSFGGVILLSSSSGFNFEAQTQFYIGIVLLLIVALLWAWAGAYSKKLLNEHIPVIVISWSRISIGAISSIVLLILMRVHIVQALSDITAKDWLALIFMGIFTSGLAFLVFYKSVKLLPAQVTAIFLSTALVVSVLGGLIIGETITRLQIMGIVLVVISIFMIKSKTEPELAVVD